MYVEIIVNFGKSNTIIYQNLISYYNKLTSQHEASDSARCFFTDEAIAINVARLAHLESLKLPLQGKEVLEVGSGVGLLTKFFEDKSCTVLSTEARADNIIENLKIHPDRQGRVAQCDLTLPGSHDHLGSVDVVFCYGTLYHLCNPNVAIQDLARITRELLLLETCVFWDDNGKVNVQGEERTSSNQAFDGHGCRPGRDWVVAELKKYFPFVYISATQPSHPDFPLSWPAQQGGRLKRSIFVASRKKIISPLLVSELPKVQSKVESTCSNQSITAQLLENVFIQIDPAAAKIGGSWQGRTPSGMPCSWDPQVLRFFYEKTLEYEHPVVLDIGANTGTFSLLPVLNPEMKCYAFEPSPATCRLLKNNIALNGLDEHVTVFSVALSNKIGEATLKIPASGTDSGLACLGNPKRFTNWNEIAVPTETLDTFAKRNGIVGADLMKIDTEGCGLFVLQGAEEFINTHHPDILLEYEEKNTSQFGYHPNEIRCLLSSWGYKYQRISASDAFFQKKRHTIFSAASSGAKETVSTQDMDKEAFNFTHTIDVLSAIDSRLYYRDQSAASLHSLAELARRHDPTVIVELGTLSGLSLRTWLSATCRARVHAVDLSFATLKKTSRYFPVDFSRVTLHEQNILNLDFQELWDEDDRVLFFVDAHDLPNVPIMRHVLSGALPHLPSGSLVVVDDLWHSPQRLTQTNREAWFREKQLAEIDELQCFSGYYAPYHAGGSFMGFLEVVPLLEFVNARRIELGFTAGGKHVWFPWDRDMHARSAAKAEPGNGPEWGVVEYNPLNLTSSRPTLSRVLAAAARLYAQGKIAEAAVLLQDLINVEAGPEAALALAVCSARLGMLEQAYKICGLARKLDQKDRRAERLFRDLESRLGIAGIRKTGRNGLTLFAVPKSFTGHEATIQKNALRSWSRLSPRPEIILFGDESGIAEMAAEIGARHVPKVARNDFGTPLVNDFFRMAADLAANDVLAYVNADIILFNDFMSGVEKARAAHDEFLLVGQRWDLDVTDEIDFADSAWQTTLLEHVARNGFLHDTCGLDYFVHTKGFWLGMPPFALGRCAWDNWLMMQPVMEGKAVIDGTGCIKVIHQNHGYGHVGGRKEAWKGIEAERNRAMVDTPKTHFGVTSSAPLILTSDRRVVERPPTSAGGCAPESGLARMRWLITQADRMKRKGRLDLAVVKYEEALQLDPQNPRIAELLQTARNGQ